VFRAALLDYNGVLVDDELVHLAAFQDALRPLSVELSEADYWQNYLGFDDDGAFRAILRDAGREPSDALVRELIEAKRPLYLARAREELKVFPGAAELVRALHRAGPVGVVSGALRDEIELGLQVLGVREQIGHIVAAEDTRAGKPDPEGYLLGLRWLERELGSGPASDVLVIEDSLSGVEAAKAAGLTCLAVGHSYPLKDLSRAGADDTAERVAHVDGSLLERLYRQTHAAG
jgi:HAD superfamily hydrolase (TIGR01509 family)